MTRTAARHIVECAHVVTCDDAGTEYDDGHVVFEGSRIVAIGPGRAPDPWRKGATVYVPPSGSLVTPGLVNCHHHLYQWLTRGYAQQSNLFEWLTELYPRWALIDDEMQAAATRAGLYALLQSGCSTTTDHHYLHPRDAGDMLAIEVEAARDARIRFHPCRGSMDLGQSHGGLPPDAVVEAHDDILTATAEAIDRWHDTSFDAMVRIAVAPCSPFSVTRELMVDAAALARSRGVRLHTHLAETIEEEEYCLATHGVRPVEFLDAMGWLGDDVWLAHCIHLDQAEVDRFGATGTGVAHCPSSNARLGAGIAPVMDLVQAGVPVGLGVDGAASNEAGELGMEVRQAMLFARLRGGPSAMSARQALQLGTIHGARCLGRQAEIGSLEVGKCADVAVWELDTCEHLGIEDPVAALVFGPQQRVLQLWINGVNAVNGVPTGYDADPGDELARQCRRLVDKSARLLAAPLR